MPDKSYQIECQWIRDVLLVDIIGESSADNADAIAVDVARAFDEYAPDLVLIDCTHLSGRLSIAGTYFHLRKYKPSKHRPRRVAVLDTPENWKRASFHETAARNVGRQPKFFTNLDEALAWLHG